MEFFLVFILGIVLAVVVLFVVRPGLFTRSNQDFSLFEVMLEESLDEFEKRQNQLLEELEQRQNELAELQQKIINSFAPEKIQSPKIVSVLSLQAEGYDDESIAKKLGLGVGEVQLILSLDKTKESLDENE